MLPPESVYKVQLLFFYWDEFDIKLPAKVDTP